MTAFLEPDHDTSDLDLIGRARRSDGDAIEELYRRHHAAALRYARTLTDPVTAEDIVAESFARVLETLRAGGGPTLAFRAYLLRAVRNVHVSHVRRDSRFVWVENDDEVAAAAGEGVVPGAGAAPDEAAQRTESKMLANAFSSLPERWQAVLWHTTVEDDDHATVGRLLGLKPNAVAALGFRARDGLRKAYLSAHLAAARDEACRPHHEQLAPYVRDRLGREQRRRVDQHLRECAHCTAGVLELGALNSQIGAVLAPALLGVSATGYAATAVATAAGGWLGQLTALARPLRKLRNPSAAAGAAAVAAAAAVAGTVLVLTGSADPDADPGPGDAGTPPVSSDRDPGAPPLAPGSPGSEPAPDPEPSVAPPPSSTTTAIAAPPPVPSTGAPTPTSSPSESPSDSPSPTAGTSPTASPSAGPTGPDRTPSPSLPPSPTPTAGPTYTTFEDLSLSAGRHSYYSPHHHLEAVVSALVPTVLTLDVRGYESHAVHLDRDFAGTTCSAGDPAGGRTVLTCQLERGVGTFAIDLVVTGPLDVVARVTAPGNGDPQPGNDSWTFGD